MHIPLLKKCLLKNTLPVYLLFAVLITAINGSAQAPSLLATNDFNEQRIIYNNDSFLHTAWKPIIYRDTNVVISGRSWLHRKFFEEHLLQVKQHDFNLNADIIFDEYIGYTQRSLPTVIVPKESSKVPMMNTRGYEITGNISDKFYFETAFYENQGRFGGYVDSFIRKSRVVPGQGAYKNVGDGKGFDFSASGGRMVYMPGKHFMFDLGYGKNFIGDGYRSLILSDWSYNYPYLKATASFGKFQYNVMWAQYISERNPQYNNKEGQFRKWSQTFLLDWKATKRLSIGVFETVMWPDQDTNRNKDVSGWIASPVMFLHGSKSPSGVPNNVIAGTNIKYRIFSSTYLYSQVVIDHFGDNKSWKSRYGIQAGIRSGNLFNVTNLNGLIEFNMARPYMYATNTLNTNYTHNNQALAHPLGANFKEGLLLAEYSLKRFHFRFESFIAKYGVDSTDAVNYGQNIYKPIDTRTISDNTEIGQGLSTKTYFADLRIAYVLNPVTNMRIETGITIRNEKNDLAVYKDRIFYIGIRMSFRKLVYDF